MSEKINTRLLVLETLIEIEKKNIFVKEAIHKLLFKNQFLSKQDRAFITRMVEGVTEYQVKLDYIINSYSKTPVNKCKPLIRCVLRMGVYQMLYMNSVPNETACDECVKLTKKKGFRNLTGFVNGVLRSIARNIKTIKLPEEDEDIEQYLSIQYSTPLWLVKKMIGWYGIEKTKGILKAYIDTSDLTIRVNTIKTSVEEFLNKLKKNNIEVSRGNYLSNALHLRKINYINRIPGFKEGEFFVQDESSMLVYLVANPEQELQNHNKDRLTILDLCAAPGGKTTHFSQMLGDKVEIEARDLSEKKIDLINENVNRLDIKNVRTCVWDALVLDPSKKEVADIVIADLPCSGLGIVSKKNDIKYHIKQEQLMDLVNLQRNILANAATYVKPDGILLYSTCTINPEENQENVEWFLSHFPYKKEEISLNLPEDLKSEVKDQNMLQLLPGYVKCDGFFIAKFRKNNE